MVGVEIASGEKVGLVDSAIDCDAGGEYAFIYGFRYFGMAGWDCGRMSLARNFMSLYVFRRFLRSSFVNLTFEWLFALLYGFG
jgi:hypothetical protein